MWVTSLNDPDGYQIRFESPTDRRRRSFRRYEVHGGEVGLFVQNGPARA
jgi:hypothetical protein